MEEKYFEFNDRLWDKFTYFFRNVKAYHDWTDNEIWFSMNNSDMEEFQEWYKKDFDLEEAKEDLIDLIDQEYEMRKNKSEYTRKEINAIKKKVANAKADIADYIFICS